MHRLLAIAALVLSLGISSAEAAKRVALVIGNDSYKTLPDLDAARKDADGIASKLQRLGWDVILKKDLSRRQAYRQIATFESKLRVLRGGSWGSEPRYLRSANRSGLDATERDSSYGFRIARTLSQ